MRKHFAAMFVAVSAFFAGPSAGAMVQPPEAAVQAGWLTETGNATYYGTAHNGRRSANGARFDQMAMTAAHPWLPFGTRVKVVLKATGKSVVVTITDRLRARHCIVDLSLAAARELGLLRRGVGEVTLQPA